MSVVSTSPQLTNPANPAPTGGNGVGPAMLEIVGVTRADYATVLTPDAMRFVAELAAEFEPRRQALLLRRRRRQEELDAGVLPDFLPETRAVREGEWTPASIAPGLSSRRVEITGPVDRKMIINALNSGADVFMADFEDSNAPTLDNCIRGQINLVDAVRGTISLQTPEGKAYQLNDKIATLMVRPRGWHLDEKHVTFEGRPVSASLFDFGLYFFHNAKVLIEKGSGPYFYLPKIESHLEARLWNDVFVRAQQTLGIPRGTIRATVLIETILAAFEMHEIIHELREHSAGLNCGRWDYIFSLIKKLRRHKKFVLSDRGMVTMTTSFMRAYSLLTIQTCHRRGVHAMGGMAAQIPIKNDAPANAAALGKVRDDKLREAGDGHDGTWVAHPGLVPVAREAFAAMIGDHQIDRKREDVRTTAADLLAVPQPPTVTEQGVRVNINVGIQYLESWLGGLGCVPINNLMEDAATAEISRTQLWQWVRHGISTTDGKLVTADLIERLADEELEKIRGQVGARRYESGHYVRAAELFRQMSRSEECPDFLTSIAYEEL